MAEPIMRTWQLSEALSRMAKRIRKRFPDEAEILKVSSEDIIHDFFSELRERQAEYLKNTKESEVSSIKEQDEKQKNVRLQKRLEDIERKKDLPARDESSRASVAKKRGNAAAATPAVNSERQRQIRPSSNNTDDNSTSALDRSSSR